MSKLLCPDRPLPVFGHRCRFRLVQVVIHVRIALLLCSFCALFFSLLVSSPGRFVPSSTRSVADQCLSRACAWSLLYQPSQLLTFSVTSVLSLWPSPRAWRSYLDLPYFSVSPTHWVPNGAMSSVCSPTFHFLRPSRFPRTVGPPALLTFMAHAYHWCYFFILFPRSSCLVVGS